MALFLEGLWREMSVELDSVHGKHKELRKVSIGNGWKSFERENTDILVVLL